MQSLLPFSLTSRRSRLFFLCLLPIIFLGFLPFVTVHYGLDNSAPVGAFANDTFPSMTPGQGTGGWIATNAFPNLTFYRPIHLQGEPATNRIVVAEHTGKLMVFENNETTAVSSTFLDLSGQTHVYGESGLMGFAFHPRYGIDSNYVYVYYQYDSGSDWYTRVSRFTVPSIPGPATVSSEMVLMHLYDRKNNHNGGGIFFGNDGYLYISNGDEGGGNNFYGHGQDIDNRLFAGVMRIDVDRNPSTSHPILRQPNQINGGDNSFTANYYIPNSNPFQDPSGGVLEEFYAIGFRNPHRMTYDSTTSQIWLGDVGQHNREEINVIVSGGNYQWAFKEGTNNGPGSTPSSIIGVETPPIYEYSHSDGNSVIGGYVYRGPTHSDMLGQYIFADYGSKRVWALDPGDTSIQELMTLPFAPSAFGTDNNNELYILEYGNSGKIYKLDRQNPGSPEPPQLLSQTGVFSSLSPLVPENFMIPYELNAPFWSDAAVKTRWMIIPNDGTHNSASEQIQYSENGNWQFPEGAVLIKHFELPIDETNPSITKKLETRFLIHGSDGNYYGMTYRWNDAETEAFLLSSNRTDTITINTATGNRTVTWYYPGRGECLTCHNSYSSGTLGPITRQLNGDTYYPQTGRVANQLATLSQLEIFDTPPDTTQLPALLTSYPADDNSASLEDRARSYIDANCASCHQPGTGIAANFDARLSEALEDQDLIYGALQSNLGITGSRAIIPGQADRSVLMTRLASVHTGFAMPQLAKNLVDTAGVELISDWINSISPDFGPGSTMGQTIDFGPLGNKLNSDPSFTISASTSSGLPVSFSVVSGPATIAGGTVTLTGQEGLVQMQATQAGNGTYDPAPEVIQSFWVTPTGSATGSGLLATYYNDIAQSNVALIRTDPQVDFYWGSGRPDPSMDFETYSVVWEGEIEPTYTETFTFTTTSDDGVRLWVNNTLIIDAWNDQSVTEFSGSISLNAWQRVPVRMEYYQQNVYASAKLEWSSNSLAREVVPTEFLYPVSNETLGPEDITLEAIQQGNIVQIEWSTLTTEAIDRFEVERSSDGSNFTYVNTVAAHGMHTSDRTYQSQDLQPGLGSNYYRIRQGHEDGSETISDIAEVNFQANVQINVYPNPVSTGESITLSLQWPYERELSYQILDLAGHRIQQGHIENQHTDFQNQKIRLGNLSAGMYLIILESNGFQVGNRKIVIRE